VILQKEDWAVEQSLWLDWTHLGQLVAQSECELICVDSRGFAQTVTNDRAIRMLCFQYARDYTAWLQMKPFREVADGYQAQSTYDDAVSFLLPFDLFGGDVGGNRILILSAESGEYHLPGRMPMSMRTNRAKRNRLHHSLVSLQEELSWRTPMTSGSIMLGWLSSCVVYQVERRSRRVSSIFRRSSS